MATKNITGLHDSSIVVSTSGNTYNIAQNAKIISDGGASPGDPVGAIMEDPAAMPAPKNNIFNVDGRVIGFVNGMFLAGSNDEVHIGATGKVTGGNGIVMGGTNSLVVNDGELGAVWDQSSSSSGFAFHGIGGDKMEFRNNGEVYGYAGVAMEGVDKALVVNGVHGEILGLLAGVAFLNQTGETGKFINHGSVVVSASEGLAFFGSDGDDTVINDGTMTGHVMLAAGNDSFDNRGGTIQGTIIGGAGDDVLITDKGSVKLTEESSGGDDTVKSTVSYALSENVENLFLLGNADINGTGTAAADKLHGNTGDNTIKGLAGTDDLWGGKGNDQLTGGADADIFHFATGYADDKITDFLQGTDKIDVTQWSVIADFGDVTSHAHNQGSDVIIEVGTDSLLIKGLHKADLTMADFIFPV